MASFKLFNYKNHLSFRFNFRFNISDNYVTIGLFLGNSDKDTVRFYYECNEHPAQPYVRQPAVCR